MTRIRLKIAALVYGLLTVAAVAWGFLRDDPDIFHHPTALMVDQLPLPAAILLGGAAGIAFGLILGGAVGNLIDRILYGWVVDFIHVWIRIGGRTRSWPDFNIADAAITCGAVVLIISEIRSARKEDNAPDPD